MQVKAKLNYLRIAPRKVRLVADMIRRKKIEEAQAILNFTIKRASQPLLKLLNSAIANAKNIDSKNLYISKITVNEGPKLKRWRAGARGRAFPIQKKTSHITLILEEIKPAKKTEKKKAVKEETKHEALKAGPSSGKEKKETPEFRKPKLREKAETPKPESRGGIRRMFRRKSF